MLKLPEVSSCYFCDIISGDADRWNVIEQTPDTLTMLNGRQFEIGQCIVVPIRHAPTILDIDAAEGSAVMAAAKRLSEKMITLYQPDGILLYQNNGVGSAQEVPHFHLHVVPRRPNSDWGLGPPHIARLEGDRRPAHLDHESATADKLGAVQELRDQFASQSVRS